MRPIQRGEQIIAYAVGKFRQQIGRGRRHKQHIGPTGKLDVSHLAFRRQIKELLVNTFARQAFEGQRRNETAGGPGHDATHASPLFAQGTGQFSDTVGGNAAADADEDSLTLKHESLLAREFS
jgi:hypothetical protein